MKRSDSDIQEDVLHMLGQSTVVSPEEVGVSVADGTVTLTGTVDRYAKKLAAVDAAHQVAGVHDVANDIVVRVSGTSEHSDTAIAQAIRRALERDARVPADQLESTVTNGWVTLEGTVEHPQQREQALRAAREVGGVVHVIDRITVAGERPIAAPGRGDCARVRLKAGNWIG